MIFDEKLELILIDYAHCDYFTENKILIGSARGTNGIIY